MPDSSIPPWLRPYDPETESPSIGEITTEASTEDLRLAKPIGMGDVTISVVRGPGTKDVVMTDDQIRLIVGRGREEADMPLLDPELSPRQLVFVRLGRELLVINCMSRVPMRVNGVTTEQAAIPAPSRCVIEVGRTALLVTIAATGDAPPPEGRHLAARPGEADAIPGPPDCRVKLVLDSQTAICTDRQIFLGSDVSCDLAFRQRSLESFHAMIAPTEAGMMLIPISTEHIMYNGRDIDHAVRLEHDSVIVLCDRAIAVKFDGDPHSRAAQLYNQNMMHVGDFTFRSFFPDTAPTFSFARNGGVRSVGRADDCDVTIDEKSISRQHADLAPNLNNVLLIDKNSSNGSFINERKVTQHRLRAGDFVEFGRNPYIVHYS